MSERNEKHGEMVERYIREGMRECFTGFYRFMVKIVTSHTEYLAFVPRCMQVGEYPNDKSKEISRKVVKFLSAEY
jgi:hypothetical protein